MAELGALWIVRHGESTANVAASAAEAAGIELIDLTHRDADVPLSDTGEEQARATARWLAGLPADQRPDVAVVSPYLRAVRTAELALAGTGIPAGVDERLRDRELGILDGLTGHGVARRYPDEAARRQRLGKFYYRPPGGESWTDVALRLRTLLGDLRRDHPGRRVLLAGVAALRAGAGVLQLAAAESTAAALSIQVPEAMVIGLPETADGAVAGDPGDRLGDLVERADVVTVGPGLNDIDQTRALLRLVLSAAGPRTALVFDAYALGALSHDPDLLVGADRKVVLTPNLTEARHLLGRDPGDGLDAVSVDRSTWQRWPGAGRRRARPRCGPPSRRAGTAGRAGSARAG